MSDQYFVVCAPDDEFPSMDEWIWVRPGDDIEERKNIAKDFAISHLLSGKGPQEVMLVTTERVAHVTVKVVDGSDPIV